VERNGIETTKPRPHLPQAREREKERERERHIVKEMLSPLFALCVWVSRLRVIWLKLNLWIHSSVEPFFTTAVAVAVDFDTV